MKTYGKLMMVGLLGMVVGCGTQPAALTLGDGSGALDVFLDGNVDANINVQVDTTVEADIVCTVECNLNTGECVTVCDLADGGPVTPPTPAERGADLYVANCAGCHGDPPGTSFAPDLTGKSANKILEELNSGHHPGGPFPDLTTGDIDDIAAFLAL